MKKIITLLPLVFGSVICFGQEAIETPSSFEIPGSYKMDRIKNKTIGAETTVVLSHPHVGVKGSPFFFDSAHKAEITIGGNTYSYLEAMYNVYDNHVVYRTQLGDEFMLSADNVDKLVLTDPSNNNTVTFIKFNIAKNKKVKLSALLFD